MQSPCSSHLDTATRVFRYLKVSVGKDVFIFASSSINLVGYADLDWVGCPINRCSTTSYFTMLVSNPFSWKTKMQPTIFESSTTTKYYSI